MGQIAISCMAPAAKANPDQYGKDFNVVVAFLSQHINTRWSINNFCVASVSQQHSASKHYINGVLKGTVELK